jgi:hypothetical protein
MRGKKKDTAKQNHLTISILQLLCKPLAFESVGLFFTSCTANIHRYFAISVFDAFVFEGSFASIWGRGACTLRKSQNLAKILRFFVTRSLVQGSYFNFNGPNSCVGIINIQGTYVNLRSWSDLAKRGIRQCLCYFGKHSVALGAQTIWD